jgi:hypothetical protein
MMVAMMLVTVFGLATAAVTVSTTTVAAATDKWSRMDLPTTLNYQMLPDSDIWDLTAGDDGTLFALVEDTTGAYDVCYAGDSGGLNGNMVWDGARWAVYPAYSDIAVFKSTDGGYTWSLMWHVPSSETGAPLAIVPQPGYVDGDGAKDVVFLAMGSRYISSNDRVAGGLSEGNIYRSMDGGANFTRVTPRCPAVTLVPGGTITSLDVAENMGFPGTYMAVVGVSSLGTIAAFPNKGEGVYTWNQNNTAVWLDLQISDALPGFGTPPTPGTMPAGYGMDVLQVICSPSYTTDGLISAVVNDVSGGDPAGEATGTYVCFYDANDGVWGGDIDSPTNALLFASAVGAGADAVSMAVGTDFNNVASCNVFVGIDGATAAANNDVYRVRGLATVTGPSAVASCNIFLNGGVRIADLLVPGAANDALYVGLEFPIEQAQVFKVTNAAVWPSPTPSFKPPSGSWPTLLTDMAGTIMAAGGGESAVGFTATGTEGPVYTTSGVSKCVNSPSRGPVFNGVGLLDDIAVSEDIPNYNGFFPAGSTWCLAEAVAEEVSPLYESDGLVYVSVSSDWPRLETGNTKNSEAGLALWRLTNGKWERVAYENLVLPNAYGGSRLTMQHMAIKTNVGLNTFVRGLTWWPRVVPQFSTDGSMFLLGGESDSVLAVHTNYREMIWYSPDKGDVWTTLPQMPIGAAGWTSPAVCSGLSESGWYVQDSNTLFVGDICGWIYKSINRGASWTDGALTGMGLEITMIRTSPIYSETGAAGTDKCLLVGTYDTHNYEDEVWLSQDGAIKDLENIGDEIYVAPVSGWTVPPLGGTVINFDKNWATNHIVYAAGGGWMDRWQLVGTGAGGTQDLNRIGYTDVSVVRTTVDLADPSASTWEHLWDADDWNNAAPKPQPYAGMLSGSAITPADNIYRSVTPSGIFIGPDGTVYVTFSIWDSSYNNGAKWPGAGDNPSPKFHFGRYTLGGTLRCLDGTLKTTEWEIMHDGLGPWDGLWLNRVVAGTNDLISLTFDWKEWRFKLAFWDDTLSGTGPAPVSPLANAMGVGALVADTSVNVPLSWQAKGGASLYEWQVSEDSAFTAANTKSGTTSDLTVTVLDLKPSTTYFWRSRALEPMLGRWNTAQQFTTVIGGESGAAQLISPKIGSTISDDTPLFTWSGVASASNYEIQVATSPTFGAADIVIDETLGNVQAYEADKELVNGTYYWQVKGTNATTDTETPWSALGSFTLDTEAGGAGTPVWVWVLIVLGVLLGIIVLVLILRTRRPV